MNIEQTEILIFCLFLEFSPKQKNELQIMQLNRI